MGDYCNSKCTECKNIIVNKEEGIMNNLNSILVEGGVCETPIKREDGSCDFSIQSKRYYRDGAVSEIKRRLDHFIIRVENPRLAEMCILKGITERGVRVVGRLANIPSGCVCKKGNVSYENIVIAEHVEFRPEFTKTPTKNLDKNGKKGVK
jgi:hypothetical protein